MALNARFAPLQKVARLGICLLVLLIGLGATEGYAQKKKKKAKASKTVATKAPTAETAPPTEGAEIKRESKQAPQKSAPVEQLIDTIILTSGKVVLGTVRNLTNTELSYLTKGKQEEKTLTRLNVHKIIYANGKSIRITDKAVAELSNTDWRIVILVEDPEEVRGLYPLGQVQGESGKANKSFTAAQTNAETRLKKRAVAKKATMVLVTKRSKTGGYGEVPTYKVEGEAYGPEPPEGTEEDNGQEDPAQEK